MKVCALLLGSYPCYWLSINGKFTKHRTKRSFRPSAYVARPRRRSQYTESVPVTSDSRWRHSVDVSECRHQEVGAMPTSQCVLGASLRSVSITPTMAADGELSTVHGTATSRGRSDGETVRGRAQLVQLPLTRPLTRPYRPVWLRCSQLSAVSKRCLPATLTHCGGRDSGGVMTVRVCRHWVRTLSRLRVL